MLRVLFLLLIVTASAVFAQTEEVPKAVKVDEFERATNGYVKMVMDRFYTELSNNPSAQGYIVNYGTDREIAIREKQIRVSIAWRKYDASRIALVKGGFREEVKTELWTVPPGAENPLPDSAAKKIDEFGKIPNGDARARLQFFYWSFANDPNLKGFILVSGSAREITSQTARLKQFIENYKFDSSRITFKNAGSAASGKTEFWLVPEKDKKETKTKLLIVPPGAKPPVQ